MKLPEAIARRRHLGGVLLLWAAGMVAIGVGTFFFLGGTGSPTSNKNLTNGGPTAVPNTGVLQSQRPNEGDAAPDFALVDARDGQTIRKLSDFRGKAVILNWYASWCAPCKAEIPEFQQAADALSSQLVVLGVDYMETSDQASSILDEFGATYAAVLDTNGAVAEHYRVTQGLPTTFFLDKDGVLRAMKTGQVKPDELVDFLAKVGVTYTP